MRTKQALAPTAPTAVSQWEIDLAEKTSKYTDPLHRFFVIAQWGERTCTSCGEISDLWAEKCVRCKGEKFVLTEDYLKSDEFRRKYEYLQPIRRDIATTDLEDDDILFDQPPTRGAKKRPLRTRKRKKCKEIVS